ncbi:MAG: modA [Cryobacterium sp.]|nr:modA [Cryobacterium sp.]
MRLTPASEEQNVSAVVTRVVEKQANAGLVYATDIAANAGKLEGIEPAGADAVVNRYPIAAVAGSGHADAGRAFVELVLSTRGRAVLASYGFLPPTAG